MMTRALSVPPFLSRPIVLCAEFTFRFVAASVLCAVFFVPCEGAVTESSVQRLSPKSVVVTWKDTNPVDVYSASHPTKDAAKAKRLKLEDRTGRLKVGAPADHRTYFLLRDRADGDVTVVSERLLPLNHASNFRDLGGYEAADGKHVRWGLIYRSAATPLLTEPDVAYIRGLDLRAMVDLRTPEERELAPTRVPLEGIDYLTADYSLRNVPLTYPSILAVMEPQYRAIFRVLLADKGPVSYNCTAGTDRSGIATALVLSALGVPRARILEDYHLSTQVRHPLYEMPDVNPADHPNNSFAALFAKGRLMQPGTLYDANGHSLLADLFDNIDKRWGSVENYLQQELGISPEEIGQLRSEYLE